MSLLILSLICLLKSANQRDLLQGHRLLDLAKSYLCFSAADLLARLVVNNEKLFKDGSRKLAADKGLALASSEGVEEVSKGDDLLLKKVDSHKEPNHVEEAFIVEYIRSCFEVFKGLAYGQLELRLNSRA